MPPIRSGRASKACDLCRKYKTRCYASDSASGTCLRCKTLSELCSLEIAKSYRQPTPTDRQRRRDDSSQNANPGRSNVVDERLDRLERTVEALVDRLESRLDALSSSSNRNTPPIKTSEYLPPAERHPAPVILIRDAANDAGVSSQVQTETRLDPQSDVISTGMIALPTAYTLLELFHIHYGRWVKFAEGLSIEILLSRVRRSPLLLCSIFLIAVRHTTQELADRLAPSLFREAKQLVTSSLLVVPQSIEFFQATLILSLWSTTIGQLPLSIDSWLLTGYALQQAMASPHFAEVLRSSSAIPTAKLHLDAWCLWNHLCVAHLQYCVGTRRQALLNQAQIDRSVRFIESDNVTNYEARMVAEVKLYWVVYQQCCGVQVNMSETKVALQQWHQEWAALFNQPRAQFLQMGFHFAHLLAYSQSLKSPRAVVGISVLAEMVRLSKTIINLAIDTADERTRHLTDHIYHIVTFSALTLCRLVHTYEPKLKAANHDIDALDNLVNKLIEWLRSIGLPCHAAHLLSDIVAAQFKKLRPEFRSTDTRPAYDEAGDDSAMSSVIDDQSLPSDIAFLYPDFIGSELFNLEADASWPQWGQIYSDGDTPV